MNHKSTPKNLENLTPAERNLQYIDQLEKDAIIERQLRFQKLLIHISTTYINSDLSDIDAMVNNSLKQIGEFVESDRSYVFAYDFKKKETSNTYEWCSDGVEPEIHNLQNVPIEFIPQWVEAHKKGEPFYIENVSLLPDDGELGLRAILEPQGVKSLITIPKFKNNELIGFIGFDSVKKLNTYSNNEKEILFVYANMLVNVIQRKENEEHMRAQDRRREELLINLSQKNEQLNEYAHAVSHDLKAPLTNIHTLIDWFLEDCKGKLSEDELEPLRTVLQNVEKIDLLIKGILDYSTIDKLESDDKPIDCNLIVEDVLQTILVPEHIKVTVTGKLPVVFGNRWRFKQLFQNLILNAITYNDKEKGLVDIGFKDKKNTYEFYVKDNGIGIRDTYFDRIFKVFNKLESTSSSSGIGLSIVKKIIGFYNGDIWVESEEGKGSTFYFTLPKQP